MQDRGNILNQRDVETNGLECTDCGFASRAGTLDIDFNRLHAMVNGNLPAFHVMDGGIITVNTETAEGLGADYSAFKTMAGEVVEVTTTED